MERLGSGWRRGGGYFGYQNRRLKKEGWEDLVYRHWRGPCF